MRASVSRTLGELLAPEGAALDLAVFRVTVALVVLTSGSVAVSDAWAALPLEARVAPLGVGWLLPYLRIDAETVRAVRALLEVACVTGAIGLFSRASFAVVTIALAYVLLPPQLGGAVFHDHHLLWFAALLAVSPSGDALSIDAWIAEKRGGPRPTHGRAHGAAMRVAWVLVGLVFFFPGVHKLAESGLAWITSDNLRNQLWWKWAQDPSLVPALRIDRSPALLRVLAALTVLFELAFLPLVLVRRTRMLAVLGALLFHQATDYFMGVRFTVLFACYTVFVPWDALLRRFWRDMPKRAAPMRSMLPIALGGSVLVLGVAGFGAMGAMHAYPFACYPTFQWMPRDRMPALAIEIEAAGGARRWLERESFSEPGPRGWALEWSLAGVYGPVDPARIDAWWRDEASREPLRTAVGDACRVRFVRASLSVDPDRPRTVLSRQTIHALEREGARWIRAPAGARCREPRSHERATDR